MNKLVSLSVLLPLLGACQATMREDNGTVATLNLYADALEALVSSECVAMYGSEQQCTPYPNPLGCERMSVTVKADGRTLMGCIKGGRLVQSGLGRVADGVPYLCKASEDGSCVLCLDIYGNTIHDSCRRGAQLYRRSLNGFDQLPTGSGYLVEPSGTPPPDAALPDAPPSNPPSVPDGGQTSQPAPPPPSPDTPPGGGSRPPPGSPAPDSDSSSSNTSCNVAEAHRLFAKKLNKLLDHDGLGISWVPDSSKMSGSKNGFFVPGKKKSKSDCEDFLDGISNHYFDCAKKKNGECYYCEGSGSKKTCRCYRLTVAALEGACKAIPDACDDKQWSGALIEAYGQASKWLFSPSYKGFYGKVNTSWNNKFPKCLGSPLVLDLLGDGIEASAPAAGVRFDLLGFGSLQTAWVGGDDALLALDWNGNGRIDSGAELFGEASGGRPHADGFAALAGLDRNGDGALDRRDPLFHRLVLWRDANRNGTSEPGELRGLRAAGVRSLGLASSAGRKILDRHGNDLSLRGSFTRADGSSGELVDVFFATGE